MNIKVIMEVGFYILSAMNIVIANLLDDKIFFLSAIGVFIIARTYTIQRKLEEANEND